MTWATSLGMKASLELTPSGIENDFRAIATKDISTGEVFMLTPREKIMLCSDLCEITFGAQSCQMLHERHQLALVLLIERARGSSSPWYDFIRWHQVLKADLT